VRQPVVLALVWVAQQPLLQKTLAHKPLNKELNKALNKAYSKVFNREFNKAFNRVRNKARLAQQHRFQRVPPRCRVLPHRLALQAAQQLVSQPVWPTGWAQEKALVLLKI
jgi:hypothetical protein